MKNIKIIAFALVGLLSSGLAACSDDDYKAPLEAAKPVHDGATYNSLTFHWDKVPGAVQYGYQLTGPGDVEVVTDVTNLTEVSITGLEPATTYKLSVWAYASFESDNTTSVATLEATTAPIIKLSTPVLTVTNEGRAIVVTWDADENAKEYAYSCMIGNILYDEGTVTSPSVTFRNLPKGDYSVSVTAVTDEGGYESSAPGVATFAVTRSELWRVKGTYEAASGGSWDATLVAYDDNSYVLLAWYGVEGYNLEFAIDENDADGPMILTGDYSYDSSTGYYYVPVDAQNGVYVYPWSGYSNLSGDAVAGELTLSVYSSDYGTDVFVWGLSIDSLVGEYDYVTEGNDMYLSNPDSDWNSFSYSGTVNVEKVGDDSLSFDGLFWSGYPIVGKVDLDNRTITFEPQSWGTYVFASEIDSNQAVVATIGDDMSVTIAGWSAWYDGYPYIYDSRSVYTKQ